MDDGGARLEVVLSERHRWLRLRDALRLQFVTADPEARARLRIAIEDAEREIAALEAEADALQTEATPSPAAPPPTTDAFAYDACLSYAAVAPDRDWVWLELVPRLEEAGIRWLLAEEAAPPGVPRVLGIEQALEQARRLLIVLTPAYMATKALQFEAILAQTESWSRGRFRLVPVLREAVDPAHPPAWLPPRLHPHFVQPIDLSPAAIARGQRLPRLDPWRKLVESLRSPLPEL
ncbi:MAG: toll/interleukin-1 receptor domain-containing protein [Anaerolineae bacterium]|nr:toll/interleukin-1 receptor domain-containing protein [Caldilineales bacterium]MDW8269550.1 toll/interleukin-1 receptor domain-containing protein [Anaerolineae bacterium]